MADFRVAGSAALTLVTGATPLRVEPALFEAMLTGWRTQQQSRRLSESIVMSRDRTVRRFAEFTGGWPWSWNPGRLRRGSPPAGWAHSTVRSYQGAVAVFLEYVCDARYGWVAECEQRVGARPVQVCHEWNTARRVSDYEGRPARRPLTRAELQAFFDAADDRVETVIASGRKGWLAAFRDAALFKVCYAFGLRRREVAMLDITDFSGNSAASELGGLGVCQVRFGKAMRGSPPRRRSVAAVMPWAGEVLESREVIERLAAAEHERWAHWQRYVHEQCEGREDGSMVIPAGLVERWSTQIATPYEELSEAEKKSDREQVGRYLPIIVDALDSAL